MKIFKHIRRCIVEYPDGTKNISYQRIESNNTEETKAIMGILKIEMPEKRSIKNRQDSQPTAKKLKYKIAINHLF
jgi:hypothetical protein